MQIIFLHARQPPLLYVVECTIPIVVRRAQPKTLAPPFLGFKASRPCERTNSVYVVCLLYNGFSHMSSDDCVLLFFCFFV